MKSTGLTDIKTNLSDIAENETAKKLIINLSYFGCGVLSANAAVFGNYVPFGAAFVSACPYSSMLWAALGVVFGTLVSTAAASFRYIAATAAIFALRWVLSDIKSFTSSRLYAPIMAFAPLMLTGIIMSAATGFETAAVLDCVTESLLSAAAAYFFTGAVIYTGGSRGINTLNQQELACVMLSGCIFLLALSRFTISGLSVGRIVAVVAVLLAAKYGGIQGGSIAGAATGAVFGIVSPQYVFLAGAYAFGGLLAGMFSAVGKLAVGVSYLLSSVVFLLQAREGGLALTSVYEILIAISVFMLIPRSFGNKIALLFMSPTDNKRSDGLRNSVIMRLDYASKALTDVSDSVKSVSDKLKTLYNPNISSIYERSIEENCSYCGLRMFCWEKSDKFEDCDFSPITQLLEKKKTVTDEEIEKLYPKKCCRPGEMASSLSANYQLRNAYSMAQRQLDEVRGIVSGEFSCLGDILGDLSHEFENFETFDIDAAERVSSIFKVNGLMPLDTVCRIDKFNRMTVEVILCDDERKDVKKGELMRAVTKACGRKMDSPCISYAPGRCRMQFGEKPLFDLQIGSAQHISKGGKLCGDCLEYFCDGMGRMISIISDGMGTGGRAAVDGNMAVGILSKLLKAGLSFECGLHIVNSALMIKSSDESLATLDSTAYDLFTGKMDFYKAGAAVSYIKKGGSVEKVELSSLPAGILQNIKFAHKEYQLLKGDMVIMLSDGVISGGDSWLETKIAAFEDIDPKDAAKEIIKSAIERRGDSRDDDMTVIVMRVVGG